MKGSRSRERRTLQVAERVHEVLQAEDISSAVIGALALAVHGYIRSTRDLDLATHTNPFHKFPVVRKALEKARLHAEVRMPTPMIRWAASSR